MGKVKEMAGQRFGRFLVLERAPIKSRRMQWICRCDCGEIKTVIGASLRKGNTKSCGCLRNEITTRLCTTHNLSKAPAYTSWLHMMGRCHNKTDHNYTLYGARGILVCERWHNVENFLADMGEKPKGTTIDRIDGNDGYHPSNCRWATRLQQSRNTKRKLLITANGITKPLWEWCEEFNTDYKRAYQKLRHNRATPEELFTHC